jgi:hypothetical protein
VDFHNKQGQAIGHFNFDKPLADSVVTPQTVDRSQIRNVIFSPELFTTTGVWFDV